MEQSGITENEAVVLAKDAQIGGKYLSSRGREVIVKGMEDNKIIVQSVYTGNDIPLPLNYLLREAESIPTEV